MTDTVDSFIDEYGRLFTARDVEGVTDLCLWPFLAIRQGAAIHMLNRNSLRDHFAGEITAYHFTGVETWTPVEIDTRHLGDRAVFASVHWHALDADRRIHRDTWTSYQLLLTSDGWRALSYVNHF